MKNVPKIDLGLTGYDELFMNDTERMETKLPHIYDIPLELIDDFPDHPFKVRDDEDTIQRRLPKRPTGIWRKYTVMRANPAHRKNGVQSSNECWKMRRRRKWI